MSVNNVGLLHIMRIRTIKPIQVIKRCSAVLLPLVFVLCLLVLLDQTLNAQNEIGVVEHTVSDRVSVAIVADWDSDGRNEVIGLGVDPASPDGFVAAYEFDGTQFVEELRLDSPTRNPYMLDVGDVNGDGKNDIVFATQQGDSGGYIYIISEGSIVWTSNKISTLRRRTQLAVGDTDQDGVAEIAVAVNFYGRYLTLYDHVGNNIFNEAFRYNEGDGQSVDIGDIDGDGQNEIVYGMGANNGRIKAFKFNGSSYDRLWDVQVWHPRRAFVAVGDADNDGTDEIVSAWGKYTDGRLSIMEQSNVVWWGGPYRSGSAWRTQYPTIGSFFNNDKNQIAFVLWDRGTGGSQWIVQFVEYDASTSTYRDVGILARDNSNRAVRAIIGDADNDGLNELVLPELVDGAFQINVYAFESNEPPVIEIEESFSGSEGFGISLDEVAVVDEEPNLLTFFWTVNSALCAFSDTNILNPTIICVDDGLFTVTLTVDDGINEPVSSDALVEVSNANPVINSISSGSPINEGNSSTITISATDLADVYDPIEHEIDCNNDNIFEIGPQTENTAQCSFADDGSYLVNVRVTDDDGGEATDSIIITVNNVAPTIVLSGATSVDEGSLYTLTLGLVTDPGDDTVTEYIVHWGDGEIDNYFSASNVTHTFGDGDASPTITVDLIDEDGTHVTAGSLATVVVNVSPIVDAGPNLTVYRGEAVTVVGTWTDPANILDNLYVWTWDLDGDGLPDSSGSAAFGDTIVENISFTQEGSYILTFTVEDKDGGVGSDSLVVEVLNQPPSCAAAQASFDTLWPPNHEFVAIDILGVTDAEGDAVALNIDSIFQDEPVNSTGDGSFVPDGQGVGMSTAEVRAERDGGGNGRFYHIFFTADDGHSGTCSGEVLVGVPKNQGKKGQPVDDGSLYDSTVP